MRSKAINLIATETPIAPGTQALFTLTKPNSSKISKTVIIDPNGQAIAQFALYKNDRRGLYQGSVSMTVEGERISAQASVMVS
jgi:hypothetical protein